MEFKKAKSAISKQFAKLAKQELFRVNISGQEIWDLYLNSFPPKYNPIYKTRTEHDCSACKQFIRTMGNVVSVTPEYNLQTLWDCPPEDPGFNKVFEIISEKIKNSKIISKFLHYESRVGVDKNFEQLESGVQTWEHYAVTLPNKFVKANKDIPTILGEFNTTQSVFARALQELTPEAIQIAEELISQGSLYRGEEFKAILKEFKSRQTKYLSLAPEKRDNFVWQELAENTSFAVAKIRNTAFGTLLVDLSNNVDLEDAVKSYERIMAPTNYRRPKSLVTTAMVDKAKKTLESLGLLPALERRFATLEDINVNDILFINRSRGTKSETDLFSGIGTTKPPKTSKIEEISIEKFISEVLPKANEIELFPEFKHRNNFVSLVAPNDATAPNLMKWGNPYSWSYAGNVTDSIKEKVKAAGGNVEGELCCRLAWYNYDDLDFHMVEPNHEIYFGNKGHISPNGGMLDVDMNAGSGTTRTPVENIFYDKTSKMRPGVYKLFVHQYNQRETTNVGFEVEIQLNGETYNYIYEKPVSGNIDIAELKVDNFGNVVVKSLLESTASNKTLWNLKLNDYHKVNLVCLSPNFWGDSNIGNKHYLFMVQNCLSAETPRPFYNEFLNDSLNPHRKVLEILGGKIKLENSPQQLSGLGFSSTQRNEIIAKVTGSYSRLVKIKF